MDIVYRLGKATAADVHEELPDAPTYTTVRGLLRILESKGHIRHEDDGGRYVYYPIVAKQRAAKSAIRHVVSTFFDGSPSEALVALLGGERGLKAHELDRLAAIVDEARRKEKG